MTVTLADGVATLTHADLTGAPHQVPRADGELVSVPPDTARALAALAQRAVRLYPRSGATCPTEAN